MLYDKKRWEPKIDPQPDAKPKAKPRLRGWRRTLWLAADYIRDHGWTRYQFQSSSGEVCMLGAIREVAPNGIITAEHKLRCFLKTSVDTFNDRPTTTKRMVLSALRRAAKKGL